MNQLHVCTSGFVGSQSSVSHCCSQPSHSGLLHSTYRGGSIIPCMDHASTLVTLAHLSFFLKTDLGLGAYSSLLHCNGLTNSTLSLLFLIYLFCVRLVGTHSGAGTLLVMLIHNPSVVSHLPEHLPHLIPPPGRLSPLAPPESTTQPTEF